MAEMPDPGPGGPDVAVVSMVRKVKSKLGYTEINTPVDLSQFEDKEVWINLFKDLKIGTISDVPHWTYKKKENLD